MPTKPDHKPATEADSGPEKPAAEGTGTESSKTTDQPKEVGGRGGLDPTRYGDWEKGGRCIDF